jgi:hypothetical protein
MVCCLRRSGMGLEVLIPLVMGALIQVAGKISDGALDAVGEAAKDTASTVFGKIKNWWSGDATASDDLQKFAAEPDIYQPVLEKRLVKKLTEDPAMQAELETLFANAGPQVDVFQSISKAHGVTGAKVKHMLSGRLNVGQVINDASDVTGVEIDELGRLSPPKPTGPDSDERSNRPSAG